MSDNDTRELKDYERAVPITAFNSIESKLHRAEQRLREGRVVDDHEEVTDAHRELSKHKEEPDEELVTDGGEPAVDYMAGMASANTIRVDESDDRDSIAGEVVLSWVVEQTATDLHYRIVVAPAGSGWVVLRQKRRGINSEWETAETHDASEKPRLVAMKGVGGDD